MSHVVYRDDHSMLKFRRYEPIAPAAEVALAGAVARVSTRRLPPGYHPSGRYMPLQGGSNTRRSVLQKGTCDELVAWYPPVPYIIEESLSAYYDRISR